MKRVRVGTRGTELSMPNNFLFVLVLVVVLPMALLGPLRKCLCSDVLSTSFKPEFQLIQKASTEQDGQKKVPFPNTCKNRK